jgi:hypothetical protein
MRSAAALTWSTGPAMPRPRRTAAQSAMDSSKADSAAKPAAARNGEPTWAKGTPITAVQP